MIPADGADAELARQRRRHRRLRWVVGVTVLLSLGALVFCLWNRSPGPRGTTIVSLQQLADRGAEYVLIWPHPEPRTVWFLACARYGPLLAGTAGPSGLSAEPVTVPPDADGRGMIRGWYADSVAYRSTTDGALYLRSPHSAPRRKLADGVLAPVPAIATWTWSPDGHRLAVPIADAKGSYRAVKLVARDGAVLANVPIPSGSASIWSTGLLWSPSGERLLVSYAVGPRRPARPHRLLLSAPSWASVPVPPLSHRAEALWWANEETLVEATLDREPWGVAQLRFFRAASGETVGEFDCGRVSTGGPRAVTWVADLQPAPHGNGDIATCVATGALAVAAGRGLDILPEDAKYNWAFRTQRAVWTAQSWTRPRLAYVYVGITGEPWRTIAVGDLGARGRVCINGPELLYVSNWELKAAPLPPQARADARRIAQSRE